MRILFLLAIAPVGLVAQPAPPDFCFVISEPGDADKSLSRTYVVKQHDRERVFYYNSDSFWLKPDTTITLQSHDLFKERNGGWRVFTPVVGVSESRMLVIAGADTMRIDLPDDPKVLIARAWRRGERDTPEVVRFRKGLFSVDELIADPRLTAVTNQLAKKLITEDAVAYTKELADLEEYYRNQPPPVPPSAPYVPPPPMTEGQWAAFWAEQPPLEEARIDGVNADTVTITFTGRIMLTGGCASNMPMFGMEVRTDSRWVECFAIDESQMDCGLPWGDWHEHTLALPLSFWVGAHARTGEKELKPGTYRLIFIGGDREEFRTAPFDLFD
ncbi:MAG: hypothetical protein IPL52_01535 [Flavobacteriales bacterium]|nr:hypothetical protein [Flavobacteriales bacterium]